MFAGIINSVADRIGGILAASIENPRYGLNDPATYDLLTGGHESESGICVTPQKALMLPPVWQAVSIISGDVATATPHVFVRDADGDRTIEYDHPVDYLISEQPNDEMSAFELWRRFMMHALIWQQGYLYIERVGRTGKPIALYNLLPDRTEAKRDENGTLFYVTEVDGQLHSLLAEEVYQVKGLSLEQGKACPLVEKARDSWGLALAAQGFASKYFANGAQTGGIIEVPKGMTEPAKENLEKGIQSKYTGKNNWFKTMVLREGVRFQATTIDPQKSQLVELREHEVRDTARFFNLPPGKLGLQDSVSYNSAEQTQLQYITGCLTHWFAALRGEAHIKLLSKQERTDRSHFIDFNASKLIERDLKTQVEILQIERQNEIINANEWRRKRDLPPRTDPQAEEYVNPNTKSNAAAPAQSASQTATGNGTDATVSNDGAMSAAMREILADVLNRMARRVGQAARKAAKSGLDFEEFVATRAAAQHKGFDESVMPIARAVGAFSGRDATALCGELHLRFFDSLAACLSSVLDGPAAALEVNAITACGQFEETIAITLTDSIFSQEGSFTHAA